MPIPVTLPVVTTPTADIVRIVAGILAFLPDGGTQKNFCFEGGFRAKLPQPSFIDHKAYNPTTKTVDIDVSEPLETDHTEYMVDIEGWTDDLMSTFVNGATVIKGSARIWGHGVSDAANTVRMMTDEFDCFAYVSSEIGFVRDNWGRLSITLRVNGAKPVLTKNASTTAP
jgi:hypothetical protein